MDILNTNRLRVRWYNVRRFWDAPALIYGHYRSSSDHDMPRHEYTVYLHLFGWGFDIKWRRDGKDHSAMLKARGGA